MQENSTLGRIAFWAVTVLAVLWAAGGLLGLAFGLVAQPWGVLPLLVVLGPLALAVIAVILDRSRSAEDRYYSDNVND